MKNMLYLLFQDVFLMSCFVFHFLLFFFFFWDFLAFIGFTWVCFSAVCPHSAFSSFLFSVHSLFLLCSSHMFPSSRLCFLCYFDLFLVYFCIFFYSFGKKAKPYFKIEFLDFPSLTRGAWPIQCGPQKRNIYFNFLIKCAPIAIVGITASL